MPASSIAAMATADKNADAVATDSGHSLDAMRARVVPAITIKARALRLDVSFIAPGEFPMLILATINNSHTNHAAVAKADSFILPLNYLPLTSLSAGG